MHRWSVVALIALDLAVFLRARASDAHDILDRADRLAEAGNWTEARDLYAHAEELFRAQGDRRDELYAKFGRLRWDVQAGSYSRTLKEVEADLKNPIVQADPQLKIRALALKGTIDLNLDTSAAGSDFSQIAEIAGAIGDHKWQNRAAGELGIVAGLNGDVGTAAVALFGAIRKAGPCTMSPHK